MKVAVFILAFTPFFLPRASGRTIQLTPASRTEQALPGIKVSWYSGLDKKMVMMRVENVSGKNINAYSISIRLKFTDGSTDPFCAAGYACFPGERMEVFPMNGIEPQGFAAGAVRPDQPIYQGDREVAEVVAVPDLIVYTDDRAEVQNERAFKQIMAMRKGELLAYQQVTGTIKRVLADGLANPVEAATEDLTRTEIALRKKHTAPEEPENNEEQSLRNLIGQLDNAERMAKQMNMSEHDYLAKMAGDFNERIALMAQHYEVKKIQN